MSAKEDVQLSGKAVKTQLSEKSWNDSILLIMTKDNDEFHLWSLTETMQLNKLL